MKGFRDAERLDTRRGDESKSKKARVVILVPNTLSCPVLHFYKVTPKYSEGIRVTERTQNQIQTRRGGNYKSKKAKVVILVHDMSFHPVLHFYQVS